MIHGLKTLPQFFEEIAAGRKTFEIRQNDRNFHVGDFVALNEYDGEYTGRCCLVKITYLLDNPVYCKEGMVAFSFVPCRISGRGYTQENEFIDRNSGVPVYGGKKG